MPVASAERPEREMGLPARRDFRPAALIPAYNAAFTVADVVAGALANVGGVLVVDDGSADGTAEAAERAGARVLRRASNGGKGSAIREGLADLLASDVTHVVFLDADDGEGLGVLV